MTVRATHPGAITLIPAQTGAYIRRSWTPIGAFYDSYNYAQKQSQGILAASKVTSSGTGSVTYSETGDLAKGDVLDPTTNLWAHYSSHAYGLSRVPYDNFPALLHQGERVQTAAEARADKGAGRQIVISGNNITVRQDSDITAVAEALADELERRERIAG